MEQLTDYPKLNCPFIRQTFKVNREDFKKHGSKLMLRSPEVYLIVNRINPGYEWVFEDKDTIAVEKLNGTNMKLKTEKGRLISLQNRKNIIDPLQIIKGKNFLIEGIFMSIGKGYVKESGEQAGELIGPKLQGNPYKLTSHFWYPFDRAIKYLSYRSFHEHERTFDNWSSWFKDYLFSRFYAKRTSNEGKRDTVFAEGVVFYNLKRKEERKIWRAKLRRDMFDWFYDKVEIYNYDKSGKDIEEDQNKFD